MVAIDLGSNSLRLLHYVCETKEVCFSFEKGVKTAEGLVESGEISPLATQRVIEALQEAIAQIEGFERERVVAYTTEAIRQAQNATHILEEIARHTGVRFEIISGDKEARLTELAVKMRLEALGLHYASYMQLDIGGASTEMSWVSPQGVIRKSFPLGIVTVAESYPTQIALEEALSNLLLPMQAFVESLKIETIPMLVATSGTPTTVASLYLGLSYATYDASKVNGCLLPHSALFEAMKTLFGMSEEEREEAVGVGRWELIVVGILLFEAFYRLLEVEVSVVIDDGLREGIALESCLENRH